MLDFPHLFQKITPVPPLNTSKRRSLVAWLAVVIAILLGAGAAHSDAKREQWVVTWGTAPQLTEPSNLPPSPGLANNTLRQVVHVSLGGEKVRLRFSNAFGNDSITLSAVHIALASGGSAIGSATDKTVTFSGRASVSIRPRTLVLSDPVDFKLPPLSDMAVTVQFGTVPSDITGHPGSRTTSYLQAGSAVVQQNLPEAVPITHWYILSGVDVLASPGAATVAILGDSITDGRGSTTDKNTRWPDYLARRFQANKKTKGIAVLNQGIGGNRVLADGLGPSGISRLDRDVLSQPGVKWLIVLEGINDLAGAPAENKAAVAQELIEAYEQIILRAHDRQIKVFGVPILACGNSSYFSPELETARQTVNTWIRTCGQFDAIIDMDAATRDQQNPSCLQKAADSGDHLHLNPTGYETMANTVALKLFGH